MDNGRTAHQRLLEGLKQLVQVSPEDVNTPLGADLVKVAKENNVVLLSFIAPEAGVKVSPSKHVRASIGLFEEYGLQCALAQILEQCTEMKEYPVWLLVHSPGGEIPSSYMIAKRIRESFSKVITFVPHVAYSGGTLIALTGDQIVLGDFSRLGPLDPQVPYVRTADNWLMTVSALSMRRALDTLQEELRYTARDEVPYPSQVMAEKLDPVLLEDWQAECVVVATYLQEILKAAGYNQSEINKIQGNLVFTSFPHDYVIHRDRAIGYSLKCATEDSEYLQYLELIEEWLVSYMLKPDFRHYIRFVTPKMEVGNVNQAETRDNRTIKRPTVSRREWVKNKNRQLAEEMERDLARLSQPLEPQRREDR